MEKILISACLIGDKTRYDGKGNRSAYIDELLEHFELVPFCPEVEGGLRVPRERCEIKDDRVVTETGRDVTHQFETGAEKAFNICLYLGIRYAILVDKSPSCGSSQIYDGTFRNRLINNEGVTARYLKSKGITIIPDHKIPEFLSRIKELENK